MVYTSRNTDTTEQQYIFPVFTLDLFRNHMMIITHYRRMGNTDGAVRGVRLKTVLLLDVE